MPPLLLEDFENGKALYETMIEWKTLTHYCKNIKALLYLERLEVLCKAPLISSTGLQLTIQRKI